MANQYQRRPGNPCGGCQATHIEAKDTHYGDKPNDNKAVEDNALHHVPRRFQLFDAAFGHVAMAAAGVVGTIQQLFHNAIRDGQNKDDDQQTYTDVNQVIEF